MNKQQGNLGSGILLLTLSKVVTLSINLLSVMLLSRYRSLTEYGTYSAILMVVNLALPFFLLGFPNALNYFYPRAETLDQRDRFLSAYFISITFLAIVAGGILYLTGPLWAQYFDNPDMVSFAYLLAILPFTKAMTESRGNLLVASGQAKKLVVITLLQNLALLLAVLATQWLGQSFAFYTILFAVVEVGGALVVLREGNRLIERWHAHPDKGLLSQVLRYSVPMGLAALVGILNLELDKLMIGYWFDTETLAIYANAGRELPVTIVASSFTAILLPAITRLVKYKRVDEGVSIWRSSVELSFFIMMFAVSVLVVYAPQVISVLYSDKYLEGVTIFRIYSCVLIWRTTYFGMILNVTGNSRLVMRYSILTLLFNVVLNITFFYLMGMIGPALATFVSMGIMVFVQLRKSAQLIHIRLGELFPWKNLGVILGVNLLMSLAAYALVQALALGTSALDALLVAGIGLVWFVVYFLVFRKKMVALWRQIKTFQVKD